jgi:hypothetical protein
LKDRGTISREDSNHLFLKFYRKRRERTLRDYMFGDARKEKGLFSKGEGEKIEECDDNRIERPIDCWFCPWGRVLSHRNYNGPTTQPVIHHLARR